MPAVPNAPPHVYDAPALDRAADRRRDETWLSDRHADPETRLVLLANLLVPVTEDAERPRLLAPTIGELGRTVAADAVFLGLGGGGEAWFAESEPDPTVPGAQHVELRSVGTLLPADAAATLAYACALLH